MHVEQNIAIEKTLQIVQCPHHFKYLKHHVNLIFFNQNTKSYQGYLGTSNTLNIQFIH